MADETQEDMSMEEILSSIKGILTEDTGSAPAEAPSPAAEEPEKEDALGLGTENIEVDDLPFNTEDADDVLDLTPDMRVASQDPAEIGISETEALEPETIDLGKELEDVEVDMGTPQLDPEVDPALPDLDPLPDFVAVGDSLAVSEPEDSDPIYIPEEDSTPLYDELSEPMAEETEVIHETEVEAVEEPAAEPVANSWIDEEAENNSRDAADVSADIINNFAKIFAQSKEVAAAETPAAAQPAQAPAAVTHDMPLGNAGQTLSDTVKEVIRDIISVSVMENLNAQMDLNSIAQELVADQVKSWLNANLPGMVESVVKKEIERVMAKAGKN